eukprot:CAMPEP_0177622658 /NCGR_PEP_ID=MMETSP0419_2-20121207/28413_1 /TAXON_ID=582737 /ORGANISM="Tetraselmis sp., Strain GSL018" /LENGTH=498 /DNA_ID=CAMNT_0019123011 /DNA_START=343 /DNA_END=1837 /DNA_ORIENTATION=+
MSVKHQQRRNQQLSSTPGLNQWVGKSVCLSFLLVALYWVVWIAKLNLDSENGSLLSRQEFFSPHTVTEVATNACSRCSAACSKLEHGDLLLFSYCNSLDWSRPLIKQAWGIPFYRSSTRWNLEDKPQLLVHYHYHEGVGLPEAETVQKRMNLEYFIETAVLTAPVTVVFYFSYSGEMPSPEQYFWSLGLPKTRGTVFPVRANIFVESVEKKKTDLCQHGLFLTRFFSEHAKLSGYVLLLNDGVRGPFLRPSSDHNCHPTIPSWFHPFQMKFIMNTNVAAVGTMLSSELSSHVQSYALAIRGNLAEFTATVLAETCSANFSKTESILVGEVGLSDRFLREGYALASLWPDIDNFTALHDRCAGLADSCSLQDDSFWHMYSGWCDQCLSKGFHILNKGLNPTTVFMGPVEDVVFVKFGGDVQRRGLLPQAFLNEVASKTKLGLGEKLWRPKEKQTLPNEATSKDENSKKATKLGGKQLFLAETQEDAAATCYKDSAASAW